MAPVEMSPLSQQYWGSFLVLAVFCALTFCIKNDRDAKKVNTARTEKVCDRVSMCAPVCHDACTTLV